MAFTEQGVAMLSGKRRCHPLPHQKAGKGLVRKTPSEAQQHDRRVVVRLHKSPAHASQMLSGGVGRLQ
jgi:hypothetical protein